MREREVLRDLFCQPPHIASSLIDGLLSDTKRASNCVEAQSRLAVKMQDCSIALSQVNHEANVNALQALKMTVKGLRDNLHTPWAERADDIGRRGRGPPFRRNDRVHFRALEKSSE